MRIEKEKERQRIQYLDGPEIVGGGVNWDEGWQDIKNLWRFFNNSHIPDNQDIAQLPGHQGTRNAVSGR